VRLRKPWRRRTGAGPDPIANASTAALPAGDAPATNTPTTTDSPTADIPSGDRLPVVTLPPSTVPSAPAAALAEAADAAAGPTGAAGGHDREGGDRDRRGLGPDFTKLWLAQGASNLGDGVYVTALPLLAATLTRDPLRISAVSFAEWLPWLLFGLIAGALLDRWDRRRVMWTVDAGRFLVIGAFAAVVLLGWATIPLLMLTGFLLGTGQTLVDTASQSLVPSLVSRDTRRLERANGRLQGTQVLADNLAGPPAGGALFTVAPWLPFTVDAISFVVSSALVAAIPSRRARRRAGHGPATGITGATGASGAGQLASSSPPASGARPSLTADIREGLRWLYHHRLLRTLALLVAAVNLLWSAPSAVMVLYAQERLGLSDVGFGLLLTGSAIGGLIGSVVGPWIGARFGPTVSMTGGFMLFGVFGIGLGLTSNPWVAGVLLTGSGLATIVFNVIFGSLRQELAPDRLLGRVVSAFRLFSYGAVPLGSLLGGVLGRAFGVRAPFIVAGVILPLVTVLARSIVNDRAVELARAEAARARKADRTATG
jgi:MFS family permease